MGVDELEMPTQDGSKLNREPIPDDYTSAEDRIRGFRRLYPEGRIETSLSVMGGKEGWDIPTGPVQITVTARVFRDEDAQHPSAMAHATRRSDAADDVTAEFTQEVAETAAISRALRNMGIITGREPRRPVKS